MKHRQARFKGGEEVEKMRDVRGKRERKLSVEAIEGQRGSKNRATLEMEE